MGNPKGSETAFWDQGQRQPDSHCTPAAACVLAALAFCTCPSRLTSRACLVLVCRAGAGTARYLLRPSNPQRLPWPFLPPLFSLECGHYSSPSLFWGGCGLPDVTGPADLPISLVPVPCPQLCKQFPCSALFKLPSLGEDAVGYVESAFSPQGH